MAFHPPCLYLLWPRHKREIADQAVPTGYALRVYRESDEHELLQLLSADGDSMSESAWRTYRDVLLPKGLFLVDDVQTRRLVATAGAVHNPNPGRYYFPFGGELGYLIVAPEHRRRGLGTLVCTAVVRRFIGADYDCIRVCVQEHRLPAIRTYLSLGFEPFIHSDAIEERWQRVYNALNMSFTPAVWPKEL